MASLKPGIPLDLSSASAGQIIFPATQNASSNANTLDDYAEQSWTPTIVPGTSGTPSYTTRVGLYTKVGRKVDIIGYIRFDASVLAGTLSVGGLPFAANSTSNAFVAFDIAYWAGVSGTAPVKVTGFLSPAGTTFAIRRITTATSNMNTNMTAAECSSNTEFAFSFTYFV